MVKVGWMGVTIFTLLLKRKYKVSFAL